MGTKCWGQWKKRPGEQDSFVLDYFGQTDKTVHEASVRPRLSISERKRRKKNNFAKRNHSFPELETYKSPGIQLIKKTLSSPLIKTFQSCLWLPKKDPFLHSEHALLSGGGTLLSISWERQTHIPIMTSVGREKKRLQGGGGKDCHSSEAKYPSKESTAKKEKREKSRRGMTIDQSQRGNQVTTEEEKAEMWRVTTHLRSNNNKKETEHILVGKL